MTIKETAIQIGICSDLSDLAPCLMYYLTGCPRKYRVLFIFLCSISALKILTILTALLGINNMPIYHVLSFTELVFMFLFYMDLLDKKHSNIMRATLWALIVFNLVDTLVIGGIYSFNSISWSLNTSALIVLGMAYFYHLYEETSEIIIERHTDFYINSAFLIYASGSLFTYLLAWKILSQPAQSFFHSGWIVHSLSNLTKSMMITYGLWLLYRD